MISKLKPSIVAGLDTDIAGDREEGTGNRLESFLV
jgi:hypothetical protein